MTNLDNGANAKTLKFLNNLQLVAVNPATGAERILQATIAVPSYNSTLEKYVEYMVANPDKLQLKVQIRPEVVNTDPLFSMLDTAIKQANQQAKLNQQANQQADAYAPTNVPF